MKIFRTYTVHSARFIPTLDSSHICSQMHGHTFKIIIEIDGPIDKKTGFVMDFYDLDLIIDNKIIKRIDHKVLNDIKGLNNPSSEFLSVWVWEQLIKDIPILSSITISEDNGTGVKYSGA
ncbi:MAG: 6-carboxytetrahydropterin synthase QueD [Candidatus Marinimicrobia bacterium]|nr:6-carboxytetrahydropterin synthase QueD [Candidatus Neomarinimicrobiota bacterium]|tara:strand:+ start:1317 stop:1676 length:360 start_codon:yes stop_codon:yes gene_type:complete